MVGTEYSRGRVVPSRASCKTWSTCQEERNVEPYPPHQHQDPRACPDSSQRPALPAWAGTFRTVLLVLAAILLLLLLLLLMMGTSRAGDMYAGGTSAVLQATIWIGLALPALGVPYVVASIAYGALWTARLRGRGYRRYPATTWMLVAGPIVVGLSITALVALVMAPASLL